MASPDRNGGALVGVSLIEVPIKLRRYYGRVLLERAIKTLEPIAAVEFAAQLHRAVEDPSPTIYWVHQEEAERVLGGT
jgi:hypothetical protein